MSNTAITVTVQDPSGQPWSNGLITYQLAHDKPVFFNGVPLTDADFLPTTLELDNTGSASFSVKDCIQMTPYGVTYRITVNPNATAEGVTLFLFLTGGALDISSSVADAIAAPVVLPLAVPFAYLDANIEMLNGVGEMYWNTGSTTPGLRLFDGTEWITIGGVSKLIAGTNITLSPPSGVGDVTINAIVPTGGITQLDTDVLAGPGSGLQHATCVMVHAFDTTNTSQFYIETETPNFPGASTPSVGLYAKNTFSSGAWGRAQLFYDHDNMNTWVLNFNAQFGTTGNLNNFNAWIYAENQLSFICNLNPGLGAAQFKFGTTYGDTGQTLGIYNNGVTPNSIWQIGTHGSDPTPFLVLGTGAADNLQIASHSLSVSPLMYTIGGIGSHIVAAPSASTIPGGQLNLTTQISGTATINTITPQVAPPGSFTGLPCSQFCFIQATGAWNVTNAGNITTPPFTAIVGHTYIFVCIDGTTWQIYDITRTSVQPGTFSTGITLGVAQQNTRNAPITVTTTCTTSGTSTGNLTVKIGPTSGVANTILVNENTASVSSANVAVTFGVPTGWWYSVTGAGDITGVTSNFETVMV